MFEDYAGIIQQKYPEISVVGANYDPPGLNMYLSRIIVSKIFYFVYRLCEIQHLQIVGYFGAY